MIGLAFEVHDSVSKRKKHPSENTKDVDGETDSELELELRSIELPAAQDVFHYAFGHAGILTGRKYMILGILIMNFHTSLDSSKICICY